MPALRGKWIPLFLLLRLTDNKLSLHCRTCRGCYFYGIDALLELTSQRCDRKLGSSEVRKPVFFVFCSNCIFGRKTVCNYCQKFLIKPFSNLRLFKRETLDFQAFIFFKCKGFHSDIKHNIKFNPEVE